MTCVACQSPPRGSKSTTISKSLASLIERGPDWSMIIQITIRLNPRRAAHPDDSVERAAAADLGILDARLHCAAIRRCSRTNADSRHCLAQTQASAIGGAGSLNRIIARRRCRLTKKTAAYYSSSLF
jgi:hypothetical protein